MKKCKKRKHPFITIISLLTTVALFFTGTGCDNGYGERYNKWPDPDPAPLVSDTYRSSVVKDGNIWINTTRQVQG